MRMVNREPGPRILIRSLRQIMASDGSAQARLNDIVRQIAGLMVAEVSSLYVRRQDGSLELYATEGLNPDAVHKTLLSRGEGLVGLIAEQAKTINLPDAEGHPAFSFRPETGEEIYHSFLGVPMLRSGRVLGVLTLQNRTRRHYSPDEEEALQTTAMVLAELLVAEQLGVGNANDGGGPVGGSQIIKAQPLSEGIALGHIVLHQPKVAITSFVSDDPASQSKRIDEAITSLRTTIDDMLARRDMSSAGDHREILEVYRMFAHDRGWLRRIHESVDTGLTAEASVERVRNDMRIRMLRRADSYWTERFRDFDDLSDRLLRILVGEAATAAEGELPEDAIILARTMGPAELLDYDRDRVRGLVIEEGGNTSHVAIVAKALGIVTIGNAQGAIEKIEPGDAAIVDAELGELYIRPNQDVIEAYSDKARFRAKRQERYNELRSIAPNTRDGQRISLHVNAGLLVDMPHIAQSGADGIGLFRTELEFMVSSKFPRRERQTAIYRQIMDEAGDKPVVFRTLDIGGDKVLPYLRHAKEQNPAMGWRAIRMSLDRPALFQIQIQSLMRAGAGRELWIMLPMISNVEEYHRARDIVDREFDRMRGFGRPLPSIIKLGAMIEVPAILWQLDELCELADFISIGSNDLQQFIFAADRSSVHVADRFDPISVTFMKILRTIVETAERHGTPVSLCGEIAGRPLEAMALIGLGFRAISMAPANIGPVKAMILSLDAARLTAYVDDILKSGDTEVRQKLSKFASDTGVEIDPDQRIDAASSETQITLHA